MQIRKERNGDEVAIFIEGRLDSNTAPELERVFGTVLEEGIGKAAVDLGAMEYISSAGLRVLLAAQKKANAKHLRLEYVNVREIVKEVFEMTGFSSILIVK